ncbi:MAG: T9SS type A sorting domain-containing protein [Bacteroidota bacterium]|nr:T9SS type A sorting domain-containing protein [Bacteroidota bacterium]
MKLRIIFVVILQVFTLVTFAQPYMVGHKSQTFTDASRSNRNITAEIYYPSNTTGNNVAIAAGQFPVLVFGHGFVMVSTAYDDVWNSLVPAGYIMVFPTTETSFSPSHTDFGKDIAFLVGAMKAEGNSTSSTFFGAVTSKSCVMGHSMGGGASFLAVQYDSTITALATLAPAVTNPSSTTAATSISIPSIIFSGANDCVAPPATHQIPMYDSLNSSCKTLINIIGASHCQFANYNFNCSFGESTCTPAPTISSAVQQNTTFTLLLPWLNFELKSDCSAGTQFQNLISTSVGITSQQNCALICTGIESISNQIILNVFPNPFSNETTIRTTIALNKATLILHNTFGQEVLRLENVNGNEINIQKGNLQEGIFFITLIHENQIISTGKLAISN